MDRQAFIGLCTKKYGDAFDYTHLPETIKRKAETIICKKHGKIEIIPRDHLRSRYGCPHCASDNVCKSPQTYNKQMIEKSKEKYSDKFVYSDVDTSKEKGQAVKIICPNHGMFLMSMHRHLHTKTGCPACGREDSLRNRTKYNGLEDVSKAAIKHHGDRYTYLSYDAHSRTVTYLCPNHGEVSQLLRLHLTGHGCGECRYEDRRIDEKEFIRRAKEVHPEGYSYDLSELKTVNHRITIKHSCGKVYRARVSNHLSGQGCSRCRSSLGEKKIKDFLELNGISFIDQFVIEGYLYRYDFCIPDLDILIEYDGEQHYRPVDYFGGVPAFEKRQELDREKTRLAKANRYRLIRISYKRFDELEEYLSRAIDRYFKYRVNEIFYRCIVDICNALDLPKCTTTRDLEKYRTFKVLKPA